LHGIFPRCCLLERFTDIAGFYKTNLI
jgi:hypothetical protein